MATIQSAIRLNDMMSTPIGSITNAMNMMLSSWESLESATSSGLDVDSVEDIRSELNKATTALDQMGDEQDEFNRKVDEGTNSFGNLTSKIMGAVAALGLAKVAGDAIDYASDLTEVQNVVDVTFGSSAQIVNDWSKTTLDAFGLNELSAKRFAGTMGAMLKSSGLAGDSVREMSQRITEMSGDMASFYNLDPEEAFNKIRSGISGETEPLKQLGINMSVANLEAFALSQGMTKAYNSMSQGEQVMLRYNYLLNATADAQGDFARTSDSFANQTKLMKENFTAFTGELASSALPMLTLGISMLNGAIGFLSDNWSVISPILMGIITALGLYALALGTYNAVTFIAATITNLKTFADTVHAASLAMSTGATFAATAAQYGFNAALLACPITWIILAIIAVIAIIYAVVAAINKLQGTSISATGVICGAFAWLGALIWNIIVGVINAVIQFLWTNFVEPWIGIIEWVLNVFNGGFNSFGDAVKNLLGNIISWFLSLGKVVTKIIDAIFGTNWTGGLESLQNKVLQWGKNENAITLSREAPFQLNRVDMTDAYSAGYDFGKGLGDKVGGFFGGGTTSGDEYGLQALQEGIGTTPAIQDIAGNTKDTADALDITNEELKYLRDIAEQEAVNRFTTAEIKVEMGGVNNNISQNMDLDGVIDYMVTGVQEAMERVAEGVHD